MVDTINTSKTNAQAFNSIILNVVLQDHQNGGVLSRVLNRKEMEKKIS